MTETSFTNTLSIMSKLAVVHDEVGLEELEVKTILITTSSNIYTIT